MTHVYLLRPLHVEGKGIHEGSPKVLVAKAKPKKKNVHGGTWRAFQRLHSAGSAGLPDQKAVAEAYHAMKTEAGPNFEEVKKLGHVAAKAAKHAESVSGKSSFGWSKRSVVRAGRKENME
eukprot:5270665-Amphidinium_carterae.1